MEISFGSSFTPIDAPSFQETWESLQQEREIRKSPILRQEASPFSQLLYDAGADIDFASSMVDRAHTFFNECVAPLSREQCLELGALVRIMKLAKGILSPTLDEKEKKAGDVSPVLCELRKSLRQAQVLIEDTKKSFLIGLYGQKKLPSFEKIWNKLVMITSPTKRPPSRFLDEHSDAIVHCLCEHLGEDELELFSEKMIEKAFEVLKNSRVFDYMNTEEIESLKRVLEVVEKIHPSRKSPLENDIVCNTAGTSAVRIKIDAEELTRSIQLRGCLSEAEALLKMYDVRCGLKELKISQQ